MNINLKLSNELQKEIEKVAQEKLAIVIDEILQSDESLEKLIKETIKSQVKHEALKLLQSDNLRSKMAQKVYPIVYKTLNLED